MLQVQTAGVGVHEGGQGQAAATNVWRRCRPRSVVVEEAGARHLSSVGSGSEADGSDASAENGAGTSDTQIRADGMEQPQGVRTDTCQRWKVSGRL